MTPSSACTTCRSPLAPEQRYCLQCGARRGQARVGEADWGLGPTAATTAAAGAVPGDEAPQEPGGARIPSRSLSTVLATATLVAGVVLGALLGGGTSSDAASASRVVLLGQGPAATAPAETTTPDDTATDETSDDTAATDTTEDAPIEDDAGTTDDTTTDDTSDDTGDTTDDTGDLSGVGDGETDLGNVDGDGDKPPLPKVTNVWIVSLTGQDRATWFGATSAAGYLGELAKQGTVLSRFTPVSASPVASGIALLGGQAPNAATTAGCATFSEVTPPAVDATTGLAAGIGCVYPAAAKTLPGELTAAKRPWKAYVQSQGTPCRRPELGALDPWTGAAPDPYRTARNPFVYFRSIADDPSCATNVVDAGALAADLAKPATTPVVSWIVPDAAHDGSGPTGVADADAFLRSVVPLITATSEYKAGGLIVIAPDAPAPVTAVPPPAAVAPTGALVLSPLARSGATSTVAYDQYGLLRSIAELVGLDAPGHAADPTAKAFGDDVYLPVISDTGGKTETF